jgi:chromosomal replication initiator protein
MNSWDHIKQTLAASLSAQSFENWFAQTNWSREEGQTLFVQVPNDHTRQWLESEYTSQVSDAITHLRLPFTGVVYEVGPAIPRRIGVASSGVIPQTVSAAINQTHTAERPSYSEGSAPNFESIFNPNGSTLNPKFSFDSFVVGSCNQFAHAAARAVAEKPSSSYNPLFIYGGVGMGKTHLMHAIGRALHEQHPGMKIAYTTSERFMNQLIQCIRMEKMPWFHRFYRQADVLLIDDIQVIAGKERTQEEFFHTFNELFDNQKQIVISSDSPPKNVSGLVERLRSRFEWGLIVDVQPPDLETKMAILDKKAEGEGIDLPEDVRIHLATRTKSNIRELEGALVKLIAYSSVSGVRITLDMAKQLLKHMTLGPEKRPTIEAIVRTVAEHFELLPQQLKQKSNERRIAFPRQIAMYLAKELTPSSLPEIGKAIGNKHHTTVIHAIEKIDDLRQRDPDLQKLIHKLIDSLQ